MVMTILEAHVESDQWDALHQAYADAIQHRDEEGLVETLLIQQNSDPNLFRILTVWSSREALEKMRQTGNTPTGVLIFRAAKAEPVLSVHKVVETTLK